MRHWKILGKKTPLRWSLGGFGVREKSWDGGGGLRGKDGLKPERVAKTLFQHRADAVGKKGKKWGGAGKGPSPNYNHVRSRDPDWEIRFDR